MQKTLTTLLILCGLYCSAQTDTLTLNTGATLTGQIIKDGRHYLTLQTNGAQYRVNKAYLTYAPGAKLTGITPVPAYKDQRFYLRSAATQGIITAGIIVSGAALTGLGSFLNNRPLTGSGVVVMGSGVVLSIATFVDLFKAGRVPYYRTL